MATCPICKTEDDVVTIIRASGGRDAHSIYCPNCLKYEVSGSLLPSLESNIFPHTASSWIREQNDQFARPVVIEDLDKLFSIPELKLSQKYERFIKYVCQNDGEHYSNESKQLMTICWCKDRLELDILFRKAEANHHLFIERNKDGQYFPPLSTYDAREFLENLGYKTNSNKIFMAFEFSDEMFKQFQPNIERAIYDASEGKLEAVRVNSKTTAHDTKIDDELISMIKSSRAVIADFTGNRTAVYYEAGFAMGLKIPVIWTCQDAEIPKGKEGYGEIADAQGNKRYKRYIDLLSFDTRQYPHIVWKDEEDLYTQVKNRIMATIL